MNNGLINKALTKFRDLKDVRKYLLSKNVDVSIRLLKNRLKRKTK